MFAEEKRKKKEEEKKKKKRQRERGRVEGEGGGGGAAGKRTRKIHPRGSFSTLTHTQVLGTGPCHLFRHPEAAAAAAADARSPPRIRHEAEDGGMRVDEVGGMKAWGSHLRHLRQESRSLDARWQRWRRRKIQRLPRDWLRRGARGSCCNVQGECFPRHAHPESAATTLEVAGFLSRTVGQGEWWWQVPMESLLPGQTASTRVCREHAMVWMRAEREGARG